jgi:hypothetical protein
MSEGLEIIRNAGLVFAIKITLREIKKRKLEKRGTSLLNW